MLFFSFVYCFLFSLTEWSIVYLLYKYKQRYENIESTTGHTDLFSPLLSCFPYTVQFQFIRHSLYLSYSVLHNLLNNQIHCVLCTCIINFIKPHYLFSTIVSTSFQQQDDLCLCSIMYYLLPILNYCFHISSTTR